MKNFLDMLWQKLLNFLPWGAGSVSSIPVYEKYIQVIGEPVTFYNWCLNTFLTTLTAIIVTTVTFFITKWLRKLTNKKTE